MKDKTRGPHWTTWITLFATIITGLGVLGSWFIVPWRTEHYRREAERGISQYAAMNDAHRDMVTSLYELEQYVDELMTKYACGPNDLESKMTGDELNKANGLIRQLNIHLAMMYMIMPDNEYEIIRKTTEPEETASLRERREKLLVAMRKAQFLDTEFGEREDIRLYKVFTRPEKEVKN